jgi:hypothetical protein
MGYFLFVLIQKGYIVFTLILSIFTFRRSFYYIIDTMIIGMFFVAGNLDSWGLHSWISITQYCLLYMLCRFILVLIIFIIKFKKECLLSIFYFIGLSLHKKIMHIILILVNIFINLITMGPAIGQTIGVSGI